MSLPIVRGALTLLLISGFAAGCRSNKQGQLATSTKVQTPAAAAAAAGDIVPVSATEPLKDDAESHRRDPPKIDPEKAWFDSPVHGFSD